MAYVFPPLKPGDLVLHTISGLLHGQLIMTTFWYECYGCDVNVDKQAALGSLDAALEGVNKLHSRYLTVMPAEYTMTERRYQHIAPTRHIPYKISVNKPSTGTQSASSANVAGTILRRTGLSARSEISVLHVPIGTTAVVSVSGQIQQGTLTALQNLGTESIAHVSVANGNVEWEPVLFHRAKPNQAAYGTPFYDSNPGTTTRVQRRRTVGVGK